MKKTKLKLSPFFSQTGFTLVELLVVVSIIGLLASIVLVMATQGRSRARDSKRIQEIAQLRTAFETYMSEYGIYPTNEVDFSIPGLPWADRWDYDTIGSFVPELVSKGIMTRSIIDPYTTGGYYYRYINAQTNDPSKTSNAFLSIPPNWCGSTAASQPKVVLAYFLEDEARNKNLTLCDSSQTTPPFQYCTCIY